MVRITKLAWSIALVVSACAGQVMMPSTSSTTDATTTTVAQPSTSTTRPPGTVGRLVKVDPATLQDVPDLEPIPVQFDSWTEQSPDGRYVILIDWDEADQSGHASAIDIDQWVVTSTFEVPPFLTYGLIAGDRYIAYSESGELFEIDLLTGERTVLDRWQAQLWVRDNIHLTGDGRLVALMTWPSVSAEERPNSTLHVYDPATGSTVTHQLGLLEKVDEAGEVPRVDEPALVWEDDRLLIVHAEGPTITEVDFATGAMVTRDLAESAWLQRLLAFWMPTAQAKGPTNGVYSSAIRSSDGNYLFVSGNRYTPSIGDDGSIGETAEPLGVTVVDTESWKVIHRDATPINWLRQIGDQVIGSALVSYDPWLEDFYAVSSSERFEVEWIGEFVGGCQDWTGSQWLCMHYGAIDAIAKVVAVDGLEVVATRNLGDEDQLLPGGVLLDWLPLGDS